MLAVVATGVGPCTGEPPTQQLTTGVVIAADGPNAAQVDTFSLRLYNGAVLEFRVGRLELSNGGLPAPHLREHLISGEPITVLWHEENGHVADRYTDAAE